MKPLALEAPITGAHLIEASAGTGKTWTIAGLYLRLVLERELGPEQILVVTFTNAATAELRERLRDRLAQMLALIDTGACAEPFCQALYDQLGLADDTRRAAARGRLAYALQAFDDAAISTIHGFCQRALADRAFSSGLPFELELMPDPSAMLEQVVADFWRRKIVAWDPADAAVVPEALHARYARAVLARAEGEKRDPTPATLARFVRGALSRHEVNVVGGEEVAPEPELDARLAARWSALRAGWPAQFEALSARIAADKRLAKSYQRNHLASRAAKCADALEATDFTELPTAAREAFEWFRHSTLEAKAAGAFERDPLALALDELFEFAARSAERDARWRVWTRRRCIEWARQEFPARLRAARAQGFDELLANLHTALAQSKDGALGRALAKRYPAALIDEFQDTDPLQYDTFVHIYRAAPATTTLFFVGDPKQAIYSFRGADLYAYLGAADWARPLPPLLQNFRSAPRLIEAVNAVFMQPPRMGRASLRMPELVFAAAQPGVREVAPLSVDGVVDPAPLVIECLPAAADGKPIGKAEARERIATAVAGEIAHLLDPAAHARIADAPLAGRDIAVLVGTHAHGETVRRALARRGVASAVRSRESVWASDEARQLLRLFAALAELQHEGLVRAALAGELIGLDAAGLLERERDEACAQDWRQRLDRWLALWRRQGALALLRTVLVEQGAYERIAAGREGERRLTNLAHLAELIGAAQPRLRGPDALAAWLQAMVDDPPGGEEAELRLESDENLVQIVTIHKSKGLEYPVVFAPFLWEGLRAPEATALYHEDAPPHRAVLDIAPDEAARARAQSERYDESLRLAYVALTRAKLRCHVVWGPIADAQTSPLAWLLFGGAPDASALPAAATIEAALEALRDAANGTIALRALEAAPRPRLPLAQDDTVLAAAAVVRTPPPALRATSFSGLMHGAAAIDLPDHDQFAPAADAAPVPAAPAASDLAPVLDLPGAPAQARALRFAFPRGPAAGDCLHTIAERIDWQADSAQWLDAIRAALRAARYDDRVAPEALAAWLDEARRAPLAGFTLADIPLRATRREIAFLLPLARVRFAEVAVRARAAGYPVPELGPEQWEGLLRGFVDLVFVHAGRVYIADYKSNHLGDALADYHEAALADAMHMHGYHLQHLLYTVAIDRWLRARIAGYDYDTHFGGVRYLFLRGMSPHAPGRGVVATRPPRALVAHLSALLGAGAQP